MMNEILDIIKTGLMIFGLLYGVPFLIFRGISDGLRIKKYIYNVTINNHREQNLTTEELQHLINGMHHE